MHVQNITKPFQIFWNIDSSFHERSRKYTSNSLLAIIIKENYFIPYITQILDISLLKPRYHWKSSRIAIDRWEIEYRKRSLLENISISVSVPEIHLARLALFTQTAEQRKGFNGIGAETTGWTGPHKGWKGYPKLRYRPYEPGVHCATLDIYIYIYISSGSLLLPAALMYRTVPLVSGHRYRERLVFS